MPLDRLIQIGADLVEVDGGGPGAARLVLVTRFDGGEQGPGRHRLPDLHGHARDHAGARGRDDVLHLHGLQHEKLPPRRDRLAGPGRDGDDRPGQRRAHGGPVAAAGPSGRQAGLRGRARARNQPAEMPVNPGGVQVRVVEMAGERAEQVQIFRNAREAELLQGTAQPVRGRARAGCR